MKTWKLSARARAFGFVSSVAASSLAASTALAGGENTTWFGPSIYGSQIDSAFGSPKNLILDDFEAASRSPGLVIEGVNAVVDGNSVALDATPGRSLMIGTWEPLNPGSAVLKFTAADIGGAPRQVGFVVTDASGVGMPQDIAVTVNYADGSLPATRVFSVLSGGGDPTDDFFIGIDDAIGIESVVVTSIAPISIDHVQYTGTVSAPLAAPLPDDFDGDGKSDIAWFRQSSKQASIWRFDGTAVTSGIANVLAASRTSYIVGTGDSNADRKADILWYDPSSAQLSLWQMNAFTASAQVISNPVTSNWVPVAYTDLDSDGRADIVFRRISGDKTTVVVWKMNGATRVSSTATVLNGRYPEMFVGSVRAAATPSLVLRRNSGEVYTASIIAGSVSGLARVVNSAGLAEPSVAARNSILSLADVTGDGVDDIIWRSQPGPLYFWHMVDGAKSQSCSIVTSLGSTWEVAGFPDLDGDGDRDVLVRSSRSASVRFFKMESGLPVSTIPIGVANRNWKNSVLRQ